MIRLVADVLNVWSSETMKKNHNRNLPDREAVDGGGEMRDERKNEPHHQIEDCTVGLFSGGHS